jgi:hypothetical protein
VPEQLHDRRERHPGTVEEAGVAVPQVLQVDRRRQAGALERLLPPAAKGRPQHRPTLVGLEDRAVVARQVAGQVLGDCIDRKGRQRDGPPRLGRLGRPQERRPARYADQLPFDVHLALAGRRRGRR